MLSSKPFLRLNSLQTYALDTAPAFIQPRERIFTPLGPIDKSHNLSSEGFSGYASVFCPDQAQHFIMPWAYERTLSAFKKEKRAIPILRDHEGEPVGFVEEIYEDPLGLYIKKATFLENERAKLTKKDVKSGQTRALSVCIQPVRTFSHGAISYYLEVDLVEISIVEKGCNPHTWIHETRQEDKELEKRAPHGSWPPNPKTTHLSPQDAAALEDLRSTLRKLS